MDLKKINYTSLEKIGLEVFYPIETEEEKAKLRNYKKEHGKLPENYKENEYGTFFYMKDDFILEDVDLYVKIKTAYYLKIIKNCMIFFVALTLLSIVMWLMIMFG